MLHCVIIENVSKTLCASTESATLQSRDAEEANRMTGNFCTDSTGAVPLDDATALGQSLGAVGPALLSHDSVT